MTPAPLSADARALDERIRRDIPLAATIGVSIRAWDGSRLTMDAPLAPNVNDKGCAFGGSLASVMTLAGWAWVVLTLGPQAPGCEVFIARSEVCYRAPVWKDFQACAQADAAADPRALLHALADRGKARIRLHCEVNERGGGTCCATSAAQFVVKR